MCLNIIQRVLLDKYAQAARICTKVTTTDHHKYHQRKNIASARQKRGAHHRAPPHL